METHWSTCLSFLRAPYYDLCRWQMSESLQIPRIRGERSKVLSEAPEALHFADVVYRLAIAQGELQVNKAKLVTSICLLMGFDMQLEQGAY